MQETGNNTVATGQRLTVRAGNDSLSFSIAAPDGNSVRYEPYGVKNGIAMAANLREALKVLPFSLEQRRRATLIADTPPVFIPADEFDEDSAAALYTATITGQEGSAVLCARIPELNVVAAYAVSKDMKLVMEDNFEDVRFTHTCAAVLKALHRRNFSAGAGRRLFCHFHGMRLDVYAFRQNRMRFANSYEVPSPRDAVYFILHVWQQLAFDRLKDELHITGSTTDEDMLVRELHRYVRNVCRISAKAEFNRSPIADIEGMPYDLMAYYHNSLKG
ncbi:DUF3822 family protein [Xylanibacter caecicola]|uniref:DUF3822 family protein n=1 Tax=Xylanibacter caecicola TaxID=2736294 RepID=UPI00258F6191|nr:DUF3822 family protein [Xylanibacter caecicola]